MFGAWRILQSVFFLAVCACASVSAEDVTPPPQPGVTIPPQPVAGDQAIAEFERPHYELAINLDTDRRMVAVRQSVRWTNPGPGATDRMVFHVIPNNKLDEETLTIAERTVESLRLDPRFSIDREGRRFHLQSLTANGRPLQYLFDEEHDTHLHVKLPDSVEPGQQVEVRFEYWIDIPAVQGRLGIHKGVTNLLNWYPILAPFGEEGWDAVPFVPWHQPWLNEAGDYKVKLRVNSGQQIATGGHVVSSAVDESGHEVFEIRGDGLRDFTIVSSARFDTYETEVDGLPIRVLAFPEHQGQARLAMHIAADSIKKYTEWFGPYPYQEFELVESFFGWNGNESSGLVMIDERILNAPRAAGRYVEHLVSHEVCHQWWYSAVGTDGYREPWIDEGLAQWFTRQRMEQEYGRDTTVLDLPKGDLWGLPNIHYRNLVHSGYTMYRDRGGDGRTNASLDEIGHLHNLFFLVYDKASRIIGMIQHRMGPEPFQAFIQQLYSKYRFRILRGADFQRELESFTGHSWQQFFDDWLNSSRTADWQVADVDVKRTETGFRSAVHIVQKGEIVEPVEVSFQSGATADTAIEQFVRVDPSVPPKAEDGIQIEQTSETEWTVTFESPEKPRQVEIDPEGWVLDSNPRNNRWKPDIEVRYSPFFTPIDESAIAQPWEKQSIVFGPGVDQEGRFGFRAALVESNKYRFSPFVAYTFEENNEHLGAGLEAVFYNTPAPNWQLGIRYEHALLTNLANDPGDQAKIYLRKILAYTTSLIQPDLSYFDVYTRFGDNFFPDEDTSPPANPLVEDYRDVRAFGVTFHADTRLPYWDPNSGWLLDANYEHGFRAFGDGETYDRVDAQFAAVQRLPDGMGWLSETKFAGRIAGGYGWPDNGEHFRFGGPGRFRGRHSNSTEGNAFWVGSLEWRFPLTGELDLEVVDNMAALRSIHSAIFYDLGESYLFDESQGGIDQALGLGLYFDIPLLSFVENLSFRVEYGRSLENDTGVFWFGLYRAF